MPDPYAPRPRARLADGELWGVPVKMHWIDAEGQAAPPASLLRGAWAQVAEGLPDAMAREGGAEGAAFCILHRGHDGIWLLMDWWAHGDILCQRLARADPGYNVFDWVDDRPLMACLWELEVIAQERQAYIDHMMRPHPNRAAWLAA
ncbi:hypothetical protein [Jannaschia sp. M317]|uniref:hypothetical protein n=1 Tax=Jannaschia sp. M317 TaxID=2867011 RepID=UPI0021A71553|nr:hypothetical protein [Jannaschia sp. M317]UWQ17415.1 hypothetical protein K3551_16255 [Jannaschia sp. M317]